MAGTLEMNGKMWYFLYNNCDAMLNLITQSGKVTQDIN